MFQKIRQALEDSKDILIATVVLLSILFFYFALINVIYIVICVTHDTALNFYIPLVIWAIVSTLFIMFLAFVGGSDN